MIDLKYSELLAKNKKLGEIVTGEPYNITLLGNITINTLIEPLEYISRINYINPTINIGNYDNIIQDSIQCENSDLVIIFYDIFKIVDGLPYFFEDISDELLFSLKDRICNDIDIVLSNLKNCPSVAINTFSSYCFVSEYSKDSKLDLFIKDLNGYLATKIVNNVNVINIDKIIGTIGTKQAIDHRFYYSSKALYTILFLKHYAEAIEPLILRNTGKLKKAIIFDCDNTLWKGILGEDGINGIDMSLETNSGIIFNKIQQIAVFLSKSGVIVGLCSKNNEEDVNQVLNNHPDIVLTDNQIVVKKINWNDKALNLKTIALELNIGLDSILFVDDSDFEVNLIKETIPEITTVKVPTKLYEYQNLLLKYVYKYFNLSLSLEDKSKTEIYKQQSQRLKSKNEANSIDDYLSSLGISIKVFEKDKSIIPRIAQMSQKTNQFNLTTKRYTESQISNIMEDDNYHVIAIAVSDKFGDNGVTGLCILNLDNLTKSVFINTFLLSCRIIGRNIEYVFFDFIVKWVKENKYSAIKAKFIPTKKNSQVENFYDDLGFEIRNEKNGIKEYFLDISRFISKNINYIKIHNI